LEIRAAKLPGCVTTKGKAFCNFWTNQFGFSSKIDGDISINNITESRWRAKKIKTSKTVTVPTRLVHGRASAVIASGII
jgi:hypothetical protein